MKFIVNLLTSTFIRYKELFGNYSGKPLAAIEEGNHYSLYMYKEKETPIKVAEIRPAGELKEVVLWLKGIPSLEHWHGNEGNMDGIANLLALHLWMVDFLSEFFFFEDSHEITLYRASVWEKGSKSGWGWLVKAERKTPLRVSLSIWLVLSPLFLKYWGETKSMRDDKNGGLNVLSVSDSIGLPCSTLDEELRSGLEPLLSSWVLSKV